jgi:hypothetical protein
LPNSTFSNPSIFQLSQLTPFSSIIQLPNSFTSSRGSCVMEKMTVSGKMASTRFETCSFHFKRINFSLIHLMSSKSHTILAIIRRIW